MSDETSRSRAFFLSIPAFSISSIRTIGEELNIAVSAIISALDCPPLSAVTGVSSLNCSPARLFASSIILSVTSSIFSIILLFACSSRNSLTDKSMTKFIFCDNWATNLLFEEKRHFLSGSSPFIRISLLVGVSLCAVHSISASSLDFPDPVGPTIDIISDLFMSSLSNPSGLPDLSFPASIVNTSTPFSSSIPRKAFICSIYSESPLFRSSLSRAMSSTSSSVNLSRNSAKVLFSCPVTSIAFSLKKASAKGYLTKSSSIFISSIKFLFIIVTT